MILTKRSFYRHLASLLIASTITITALPALAHSHFGQKTRIVSTSGALTEIVYALNAAKYLVGVDTTSTYPDLATKLPQVGYQRALSAEGILSLNPSIVLGTDEAGPPAVIEQIKSAGTPISMIPTDYSVKGVIAKIRTVAKAVNKQEAGEALVDKLEAEIAVLHKLISNNNQPPKRTIFLMNIGHGSPMVAGSNTAANALIKIAGGINPVTSYEGYKPMSVESLININPEIIIMTQRTLKSMGGQEAIMEIPGIAMTDAGKNQHIIVLDGLSALGFTPRLPEAATALHKQIYTDTK